jgi:hypothetical protein
MSNSSRESIGLRALNSVVRPQDLRIDRQGGWPYEAAAPVTSNKCSALFVDSFNPLVWLWSAPDSARRRQYCRNDSITFILPSALSASNHVRHAPNALPM